MAYNFNMKFTYRLVRWERLAHDRQVFNDAIETKEFQILANKYYFSDTGYSNSDYLFVLYKNI